jgi:hypothetical protein
VYLRVLKFTRAPSIHSNADQRSKPHRVPSSSGTFIDGSPAHANDARIRKYQIRNTQDAGLRQRRSLAHAHTGGCGARDGAFGPIRRAACTHQRNQSFFVRAANSVCTGHDAQRLRGPRLSLRARRSGGTLRTLCAGRTCWALRTLCAGWTRWALWTPLRRPDPRGLVDPTRVGRIPRRRAS